MGRGRSTPLPRRRNLSHQSVQGPSGKASILQQNKRAASPEIAPSLAGHPWSWWLSSPQNVVSCVSIPREALWGKQALGALFSSRGPLMEEGPPGTYTHKEFLMRTFIIICALIRALVTVALALALITCFDQPPLALGDMP